MGRSAVGAGGVAATGLLGLAECEWGSCDDLGVAECFVCLRVVECSALCVGYFLLGLKGLLAGLVVDPLPISMSTTASLLAAGSSTRTTAPSAVLAAASSACLPRPTTTRRWERVGERTEG